MKEWTGQSLKYTEIYCNVLDQLHQEDIWHIYMKATLELIIQKCTQGTVYWPQIIKYIEQLVKSCEICQENSHRNKKDPSILREVPLTPWSTIESDPFILDDHIILLVLNVTSWFPVVRILNRETCTSVMNALKGVYCDLGLPRKIKTDNGPCFKAVEFDDFHAKLEIIVEKSSAYNHQSVGSIERMVQTVKQIMVKNPQNAWLAMLIFKATWIPDIHKNPAELLNSRKYCTNLPMTDLNQKVHEPELGNVVDKHQSTTSTGKELPKLDIGTKVLYEIYPDASKIKCPQWLQGTIKNRETPRRYHILADDSDRGVTRSRYHIKAYFTRSWRVSKGQRD